MELIKLSASKLKTYSSCARKFFYDYEERAETTKHVAALMGTAVHRTVEHGYRERKSGQTPTNPVITFSRLWQEELAANPDTMPDQKVFTDGLDIVQRYNFEKRTPIELELEFRLPFPDPIEPICEIHGYIDQMYDWGFVDLKTSKRKPNPVILDNDLQFIVYRWAFFNLTGEMPNHIYWHHLRTGEDLEVNQSKDKLDFAIRVVERILDSRRFELWDRNIGEACIFCSHRQVCLGG